MNSIKRITALYKISVAMTTYNGEKYLPEQLGSILKQSRQVDELVVCDDGSVDNTVNILNEFSSTAPFSVKIIINEKNLGSTKNFEKAMSICGGDIIILCDQDDIWLPDKVKVLENIFSANPNCGMAFTNAMVVDEKNNPQGGLWAHYNFGQKKQKQLRAGNGLNLFIGGNVVTGATAAVAKTFFEETIPFPASLVHDHWLATIAVLQNKLFFSDTITINYRRHSSQQLGTPFQNSFSQRANNVFDFDKSINSIQIMLNELNDRFHLQKKLCNAFTNRINFYRFRNNLQPCKLTRIPKIIMNLLLGNYHKHASGFLSAGKDIATEGNV